MATASPSTSKTPPRRRARRGGGRGLLLVEDIGTAISQSEDVQSTLDQIVRMVAIRLDMEVCSVYSYTRSTDRLVLLATHGLGAAAVGFVSMGVEEGLTGFVIEKGEPVMAIDALAHPRYKYFPEIGEERYHSFLGVPIVDRRESLGVLVVQTSRRRRFTRGEVRLLKAVAVPIAGLMAQVRLLQSLESKEEERLGYQKRMQDAIRRLRSYEVRRRRPKTQPNTGMRLSGVPASPGFGVGRAHLLAPEVAFHDLPAERTQSARREIGRFREAVERAGREIERLKTRVQRTIPEFDAAVLDAHMLILRDETFAEMVVGAIEDGASAEAAVESAARAMATRFERLSDAYMQERAADVKEIGRRLLRSLLGVSERRRTLSGAAVVVAPEMSVSELLLLPRSSLKGIAIATGGATSHAAILAKSLDIPTVVGVEGLIDGIRERDRIIVDGNAGTIYVNPSPDVRREYERLKTEYRAFSRELDTLRSQPAETRDGRHVSLEANIGLLGDLDIAQRNGADAIGLYRTEFAFLTHRDFLSEEEQHQLYSRVVRGMQGKPVTIRTLDLGADKYPPYLHFPHESNPFLGWRSTRISLDMADVFKTQMRAILRTSALGPVRIMFPMISGIEEIRRVKELLDEAADELRSGGYAFDPDIPIGIMIEVPSAVLMADQLVREVDFFSLGTNDLTQYLLAVDRDNPRVANLYESMHPAVLRSLARAVLSADQAGKQISLCGEMASDPLCTLVLIGLGLRQLSMSAFFIPVIKSLIRSVDLPTAQALSNEVLQLASVKDVKGRVFEEMRRLGLIDLLETYH